MNSTCPRNIWNHANGCECEPFATSLPAQLVSVIAPPAAAVEHPFVKVDPFSQHGEWNGRKVSFDGTNCETDSESCAPLDHALVAEFVAHGSTSDRWDGTEAAVMKLHDGRYVSFETFYGPTGDGFSRDAYGGDADIVFSSSYEAAIMLGLTEEGRRLCGLMANAIDAESRYGRQLPGFLQLPAGY